MVRIGVIMGSRSDWETMRHAADTLDALGIGYETKVVSAHRTPDRLVSYAKSAADRGLHVIIARRRRRSASARHGRSDDAGAGAGVPVQSAALSGLDSLLSIVQMPGGVPVGTLAIGKAGAINAALLAAGILANNDPVIAGRLDTWRVKQTEAVSESPE